MLRTRIIAGLSCLVLLTNALSPVLASTAQAVRNRAKPVALPGTKRLKGVPLMDLSKTGVPPRLGLSPLVSKLNDDGQLAKPTSHAERATWSKLAAEPGASGTKARALVYLAEDQIGREEPAK